MFKKPTVWMGLATLGGLSLVFIAQNFTAAWPVVSLRVTMSREQALAQAAGLAERYGWGPADYRQAAAFSADGRAQFFVELEGGGKPAFAALIKGGLFAPYFWEVRHFQEHQVNETTVLFTPQGRPYGFKETIAEDAPGPALAEAAARQIAESAMRNEWRIPLDEFQAVETSREVRANQRADHTFVYERVRERLGEGRYRLRAEVCGDRFTALTNFIKVPEAFDRRYAQMRSANNTIAMAGGVVVYLLYFGAGCVAGLFFLLRKRWLLWRPAVIAGAGIALLGSLSMVNYLARMWMGYDTAQPASVFLNNIFIQAAYQFLFMAFILGLSIMAAEGFTRRALPGLVQFWRVWRPGTASSPEIAGQTAGGYVLAALLVAYDIGVYMVCNRLFGWWAPSDTLMDPNIVSMYVPWLSPFAMAFQAGVWEECLFRAVPLAGALLLGRRWGRPKTAVALALVLQALVFGAAHANYPQQPAYVRIVEIAPAFLVFGLLYLRFGLLPVIVAHYAVDMALMSTPLFFTDIPGIWASRAMAVVLLAAPALAVAAAALARRKFAPVSGDALNAGWVPAPAAPPAEAVPETPAPRALSVRHLWLALALGCAGGGLWLAATDFAAYFDRLQISRQAARRQALAVLAEAGLMPTGNWQTVTSVSDSQGLGERYIWREFGPEGYRALQTNGYLGKVAWQVQLKRFDAGVDVAERAESFGVELIAAGRVERTFHALPEARPGAAMLEADARKLARAFLADGLQMPAAAVREIASDPAKRPNRTDWSFTFSDGRFPYLTNDEARVRVVLADGKVVNHSRYIHVPEPWARAETDRTARLGVFSTVCSALISLLYLAGMIAGVVWWSRGRFSRAVAGRVFLLGAGLSVLAYCNGWPATVDGFSTAAPFANQALQSAAMAAMGAVMMAGLAALCAGMAGARGARSPGGGARELLLAAGWGVLFEGLASTGGFLAPRLQPYWPGDAAIANTFIPWLGLALGGALTGLLMRTAFMLLALLAGNGLIRRGGAAAWLGRILLVLLGVALAGRGEIVSLPAWIGLGLMLGVYLAAVNEWLLRSRPHLLPVALAAAMALNLCRNAALNASPGAMAANLLAALAVLALGWRLARWLRLAAGG